jgi:hypothetical protein
VAEQTPSRSSSSRAIGNNVGQLSIDVAALSRRAEEIASYASYGGTELQVDALLSVAGELRNLAAEIEALR